MQLNLHNLIFLSQMCTYVVEKDPVNTTVCEGDNATFTCAVIISSTGIATNPKWVRNGVTVVNDTINYIIMDNLTGMTVPVNVSSTLTVINVTQLDDGALYQCGIFHSSNSAELNVLGMLMLLIPLYAADSDLPSLPAPFLSTIK